MTSDGTADTFKIKRIHKCFAESVSVVGCSLHTSPEGVKVAWKGLTNLIGCTWGRIKPARQALMEGAAQLSGCRRGWYKARKLRPERTIGEVDYSYSLGAGRVSWPPWVDQNTEKGKGSRKVHRGLGVVRPWLLDRRFLCWSL